MVVLTFPTEEEMHAAFEPYVRALGAVVHSWNYLHEMLGYLYVAVEGGDYQRAVNDWYSIKDDTRQRRKLRNIVVASPTDRWLPRLPAAQEDLLWLVDETDAMAESRNNAVHAPCSLNTSTSGTMMVAAFHSGHPPAKNLQGIDLITEFEWFEWRTETLSRLTIRMMTALTQSGHPWPGRVVLPERGQKRSQV